MITTMMGVIIVIILFLLFDDFGVKNDQQVSNIMILMGGKKGQKIQAGVSPPPFRAMPERKHFFM